MRTRDVTYIAVSAALICICSWIAVPAVVPFTLQTFAVFLVIGLLGGKRGFFAVFVYLIIGALGVPVFSGFRGGLGTLLGSTGGYLIGFLFTAAVFWLITHFFGEGTAALAIGMACGMIVCYAFGTMWFMIFNLNEEKSVQFFLTLLKCVIPFIIPDAIKIYLALKLSGRLKKLIR
ncbi:MAG: biotin transporter BioY [Acutalibacteraceae bacterium]